MKKKIVVAAVVVVTGVALAHWYFSDRGRWTTAPELTGLARSVSSSELVSGHDPQIVMQFDAGYEYLGGQKFILYGVADTEQYFFAKTGDDGELTNLFWLQFEAYLPDNSYSYDYDDSPGRLRLGEFDFYVDTAVVAADPNRKRRRGTDGAMVRHFLQSKGLAIPQHYLYSRLVHLTDDTRRKELMVIYIEDLSPRGIAPAELQDGGEKAELWPGVEQRMLDEIRRVMRLSKP